MANTNEKDEMGNKIEEYRGAGPGMVKWCEDNIRVPVIPEGADSPKWCLMGDLPKEKHSITGKSYYDMWETQKIDLFKALEMDEEKRFKHRLIVFIEPRGEGKSLKAVLVQLWKFFCFPRQKIMLAANSRDQIQFSHYDIMRDIIRNSPRLHAIVGKRNIKEKEICLKDSKKNIVSIIRCISSFSGIYSNITGFTFSEMFDLRNETFFSQIYGSTRNMPNALGVVDSTVSAEGHILHRLYQSFVKKKDPKLFVSYRCSEAGHHSDYLNPNMTPEQIASYRATFPKQDFSRYILNLWKAGSNSFFDKEQIEASRIIGLDYRLCPHEDIIKIIKRKDKILEIEEKIIAKFDGSSRAPHSNKNELDEINDRVWHMDSLMPLRSSSGLPKVVNADEFNNLTRLYDTNWSILAGVDRADPESKRSSARTMLVIVAKGAIGSRSMDYTAKTNISYIYAVIHVGDIKDHSLNGIKEELLTVQGEMSGIDNLTSERWGMWDLAGWCEENEISFEMIYPSPDKQKSAFNELYYLYNTGRIKIPTLGINGSKGNDILKEEAGKFEYNVTYKNNVSSRKKTLFGSPEKFKRYGVQDDALYALAWAVYGGREIGFDDLRSIEDVVLMGEIYQPDDLSGNW